MFIDCYSIFCNLLLKKRDTFLQEVCAHEYEYINHIDTLNNSCSSKRLCGFILHEERKADTL